MSGFGLQLKAALQGDFEKELAQGRSRVARALRRAVDETAGEGQSKLRQDLARSGLARGEVLGKTWRVRSFPRRTVETLGPAAEIRSSMPLIVRAFEEGAVIRGQEGRWLAIPNPAVWGTDRVRKRRGQGIVGVAEGRFGPLRMVFLKGRKLALLVADVRRGTGKRGGFRKVTDKARARGDFEQQAVFFLVPQARLPRLLRGDVIRGRIGRDAPNRIATLFARYLEQDDAAGPRRLEGPSA